MCEMISFRSGRYHDLLIEEYVQLQQDEVAKHLSILEKDREKIKMYLSEEDREWAVWTTDTHEYGEIMIKSTQYESGEGSEVFMIIYY